MELLEFLFAVGGAEVVGLALVFVGESLAFRQVGAAHRVFFHLLQFLGRLRSPLAFKERKLQGLAFDDFVQDVEDESQENKS